MPGLRPGAVLEPKGAGRWLVLELVEQRLEGLPLYVAAKVASLEPGEGADDEALEPLLAALEALLALSAMPSLEAEDAREALARLRVLTPTPTAPGHGVRIKPRLRLLRERFMACPQTSHEARGLILRLEALLKRKGLP